MENSLLVQSISLLTPDEKMLLKQHLESSCFNSGKHRRQILKLFTHVADRIAEKKWEELEKKAVFEAIFPAKTHETRSIENLMTELMNLLRRFIAQQEMAARWGKAFEEISLARFFRQRNMDEEAFKALNRGKTFLSGKDKLPLEELPLLNFWVEKEQVATLSKNNRRKGDLHLSGAIEALTVFYGCDLMKFAATLAEQHINDPNLEEHWQPFLQKMRAFFAENGCFSNSVIFLLDQAIDLMSNIAEKTATEFQAFLSAFRQREHELPADVQRMLAAYCRNFVNRKRRQSAPFFNTLLFELYKEHLEKGWMYEYKKLQPVVLVNMVNLGIKANEMDWVLALIEKHRGQVLGKDADLVITCCLANYYFHTGQIKATHDAWLKLHTAPKLEDPGLDKLVRILSIKIAYEELEPKIPPLPDDSSLLTLLKNFNATLTRKSHRLNSHMLEVDKQFVKIVKAMVNSWGHPKERGKIKGHYEQLQAPGYAVAEKEWLLEKLRALLPGQA